jgi:hypothetical protein
VSNVKFVYLYRDAGNYKEWAHVVFSNPDRLPLASIDESFRQAFLPDGLFVARQIQIPEIFPFVLGEATSDDHCFHEFGGVEPAGAAPNDQHLRSIAQLIFAAGQASENSWAAFDPHDRPARQRS